MAEKASIFEFLSPNHVWQDDNKNGKKDKKQWKDMIKEGFSMVIGCFFFVHYIKKKNCVMFFFLIVDFCV